MTRLASAQTPMIAASVCSHGFPAGMSLALRAAKQASAPAGAIRWTCTGDDLRAPVTVEALGERLDVIWMTRDKDCHVDVQLATP